MFLSLHFCTLFVYFVIHGGIVANAGKYNCYADEPYPKCHDRHPHRSCPKLKSMGRCGWTKMIGYCCKSCPEACKDKCPCDRPKPRKWPTPSPTGWPTPSPTEWPTPSPTEWPTPAPTEWPTPAPTEWPTPAPTGWPTPAPTEWPTPAPTEWPTPAPTEWPTPAPTDWPTPAPTEWPTPSPTEWPTPAPTDWPTPAPTNWPTPAPTDWPTPAPTEWPTPAPTDWPTPAHTDPCQPNPCGKNERCVPKSHGAPGGRLLTSIPYECVCGSDGVCHQDQECECGSFGTRDGLRRLTISRCQCVDKCASAWSRCGGQNWHGPTCCVAGYHCVEQSRWVSRCRRDHGSSAHASDMIMMPDNDELDYDYNSENEMKFTLDLSPWILYVFVAVILIFIALNYVFFYCQNTSQHNIGNDTKVYVDEDKD